jgi:hypothetical protein
MQICPSVIIPYTLWHSLFDMTDKFGAKLSLSDFEIESSDNFPQPVAVTNKFSNEFSANE